MNELMKGDLKRPVTFPKDISENKTYSSLIELCKKCTQEQPSSRPSIKDLL